MSNSKMPVCMITGLGEGTGGFTARRFAKAGYRVAMLARTEERLKKFEKELPGSKGYVCDVSDLKHLESICKKIKNEMSAPEVLIHNAVKGNFECLLKGKELHHRFTKEDNQECIKALDLSIKAAISFKSNFSFFSNSETCLTFFSSKIGFLV